MNLLRSLQFHRARATRIVADLLPHNTSQALIATSTFTSLTGTSWPFRVFAHDVKDTCCCFPYLNSVYRYFHVTLGCSSLDRNVDNIDLLEKLPTAESVEPRHEVDSIASDSLLVQDQSLVKDVPKSDVDSHKTESRIHVDESKREVVVYVDNEFMKIKAINLYKAIKEMDTEQVGHLILTIVCA